MSSGKMLYELLTNGEAENFKDFLKTPKGKLVLAGTALLASWIFLFWQLSGDLSSWVPDPKRETAMKVQIRKLAEENRTLQLKIKKIAALRQKYREKIDSEWNLKKDGDPEILLPQKIEAAAKEAELKLNNFGSVKLSRINTEFFYAELDVSANAPLENIVKFAAAIRKIKPKISWRRFNANVMMRRPQRQNAVSTTSKTQTNSTDLIFSGTLRAVIYDGENANVPKPSPGGVKK